MEKFPKHSRAGFTLIELALAALLVGIGLVSLVMLGRTAVRTALEVEDERRATALAEDIFATLRSASSVVYREHGYEACLEFWHAVTNSDRQAVLDFLPDSLLLFPAGNSDYHVYNDAMPDDDEFPFPFYHTEANADDYVFRPATVNSGTLWDARYNIGIELKNFVEGLPPNVVSVTLHIRPRTTHLKTEKIQFTEYLTFYTHIPLEPLRQTLFSEAR